MPDIRLRKETCWSDHQQKEENGRRKNLIFAITGGIFHSGLEERYQGEKSKSILKRKQHSDWLLIRKRQNCMKESRHKNARREIWRILSAYFFGYWRTSDQNARRMSPFLTESEV